MFPFHQHVQIERVSLEVTDLKRSTDFYENLLGLTSKKTEEQVELMKDDRVLLVLKKGQKREFEEEGLFHIAFILESKKALGQWYLYQEERGLKIEGASDHEVSQAFYLKDPDGYGIEVYADYPKEEWYFEGQEVQMTTKMLDIRALIKGLTPPKTLTMQVRVGHLHLQVIDAKHMQDFYQRIGLATMQEMPGAIFTSYESYHHHLAFNQWKGGFLNRVRDSRRFTEYTLTFREDLYQDFVKHIPKDVPKQITKESVDLIDPIGVKIHLRKD